MFSSLVALQTIDAARLPTVHDTLQFPGRAPSRGRLADVPCRAYGAEAAAVSSLVPRQAAGRQTLPHPARQPWKARIF